MRALDPYGNGQHICLPGPHPTAGYSTAFPADCVTRAKNGFEHMPVSNGAPANVAVVDGPLNAGGSVTIFPDTVETNDVLDDVCVDNVVGVFGA